MLKYWGLNSHRRVKEDMHSLVIDKTCIKDSLIIQSKLREDSRGYFCRAYCKRELESAGLREEFVQCNFSHNPYKNTLRGLHIQSKPHSEGKLIRCVQGSVYDVIIDLRAESPTFRNIYGTILSAEKQNCLYAPPGTAHGFISLEDHSSVYYMVSEEYAAGSEISISAISEDIDIDWGTDSPIMSEKDRNGVCLEEAINRYNNE